MVTSSARPSFSPEHITLFKQVKSTFHHRERTRTKAGHMPTLPGYLRSLHETSGWAAMRIGPTACCLRNCATHVHQYPPTSTNVHQRPWMPNSQLSKVHGGPPLSTVVRHGQLSRLLSTMVSPGPA